MNRPAFSLLHSDPEWQDYMRKREERANEFYSNLKARAEDERVEREMYTRRGFMYSGYALYKLQLFKACFPNESQRSYTKRMMDAAWRGIHETEYFKLESSGFGIGMWYRLKNIPDKYCVTCFGLRIVHKDFFLLVLAPLLEYRCKLVRFRIDEQVFEVRRKKIQTLDGQFKARIKDVRVEEQTFASYFLSNPQKLLQTLQYYARGKPCWPCRWKVNVEKDYINIYAANDVDGVSWMLLRS